MKKIFITILSIGVSIFFGICHAETFKISANDADSGDDFGTSVAISGNYVIIGADDDNGDEINSGAAYIFELSGGFWIQRAKLTASDPDENHYFGCSVSLSENYAIVGAKGDDDIESGSGAAYIFERSGDDWIRRAKLKASDSGSGDNFGCSVSISGNFAIIGTQANDEAAYIFERLETSWIQRAKLTCTGVAYFGESVSISGDYAIVGDKGYNSPGAAYLYRRSGDSWIECAKLTASDADNDDCFGDSVSISGNYAIVGARNDNDNGNSSGSAYIFERFGDSWIQRSKLTADDGDSSDYFGRSVSISGDYAIVGADGNDHSEMDSPGAAYIYERSGEFWIQKSKLTSISPDDLEGFGEAVSISGGYAIVGADNNNDVNRNAGCAYIFDSFRPDMDSDSDGILDSIEESGCTDPQDADSDDDGIPDGIEDFNQNGEVDSGETNPCLTDTDGDGIQDGTELGYVLSDVDADTNTNIFVPDSDPSTTTDPLLADTDGDGLTDGQEDVNYNGRVDVEESNPRIQGATGQDLMAMGKNEEGQLGNGTFTNHNTPIEILSDVSQVVAGRDHSLFVKTDGTLWAMGYNGWGELGDGTTINRITPVQVGVKVAQVTAKVNCTLFVKTDGTLWGMGNNSYGQLGDDNILGYINPVQVATDVKQVDTGGYHTLFVTIDKKLFAMGHNLYGQLGDGTFTDCSTPKQVATDVVQVATGNKHSLFIKSDRTLWAVGYNANGQLGDGTFTTRNIPVQVATDVSQVVAGYRHTLFKKTDGTLWGMGCNYDGQLGDGTNIDYCIPVQIATDIELVASGDFHSFFIKTDGTLWAMGSNDYGQLGDGSLTNHYTPVLIGTGVVQAAGGHSHSLFIESNGYTQGSIVIDIKDEKGKALNGYLLLKLPPPKTPLLIPDMKTYFYPYFDDISKVSFVDDVYLNGTVLACYYVYNGKIKFSANDLQDINDDLIFKNKIDHLSYDQTRFFFFYPYDNPIFYADQKFDIPDIPDEGDVTWWTMHYRSSDPGPLVQYVTMVSKNDSNESLWDWTEGIGPCDNGMCYSPNHEDRQNFVLEAPVSEHGVYNGYENPILLVHGINGQSGYWNDNVTRLRTEENSYNTWGFYYRGTEDIPNSAYLLKLGVEKLFNIYNQSNADKKISMVTHSYGGVVARKYCIDYEVDAETKVNQIMMIAPPHHGSYSAKRVYDAVMNDSLFDPDLPLLQRLWIGQEWTLDPMAPIYQDLAPGSENLMEMVGRPFPDSIKTIVVAGIDPIIIQGLFHDEAPLHDDGPVSISSASLLPEGVPLGFINLDHDTQRKHEDAAVLINQFARGNIPIGQEEVLKYLIEDSFPRTESSGIPSYEESMPSVFLSLDKGGIVVDCRDVPNITKVEIDSPNPMVTLNENLKKNFDDSIFYFYYSDGIFSDGLARKFANEFSDIVNFKFFSGDTELIDLSFTIYPCATNIYTLAASQIDKDGDGLADVIEAILGTDPNDADTDDDGILDGDEDSNHDGVVNLDETDPTKWDTDDDDMPDGWEVASGLDPLSNDANFDEDNDLFTNLLEYLMGTDANNQSDHPDVSEGFDSDLDEDGLDLYWFLIGLDCGVLTHSDLQTFAEEFGW